MEISSSDLAPILAGIAAVIGSIGTIVIAVVKHYSHRVELKIKETFDNTYRRIIHDLCESNLALTNGIAPKDIFSFDVVSPSGESFNFPLFFMTWVEYFPGLHIQLIKQDATESEIIVFAQVDGHLPLHSHSETEIVRVETGMMQDSVTMKTYMPGDMWEIPAGELHSVWFRRGTRCSVTLRPPLKNAEERPIKMDNVESLF
jgi:hypothetical protein